MGQLINSERHGTVGEWMVCLQSVADVVCLVHDLLWAKTSILYKIINK